MTIPGIKVERRDTRRRFEQWAKNPECQANTVSAVLGIPMAEVAKAEGIEPSPGQSPFAIARGRGFERVLFDNAAERLRSALIAANVITEEDTGFRDLRLRLNGGELPDLDAALQETADLLDKAAAAKKPNAREAVPAIVAGATISIPGGAMLPEAILVMDVLVIRRRGESFECVAGEIKTYPDRGGYTDAAELATARAQLGVYVHGLELILSERNLAGSIGLSKQGFLVLSKPGFNIPSIRPNEDLRYQVERAMRGLARLREVAASAKPVSGENGIQTVRSAPCSYSEACLSFCDRASACYRNALDAGDPVILGEEVARFLGRVDLGRACELLAGTPPKGETERDLSRRLRELKNLTGTK